MQLNINLLCADAGTRSGHSWVSGLTFYWVGKVLTKGSARPLSAADLVLLEEALQPRVCSRLLWDSWTQVQ